MVGTSEKNAWIEWTIVRKNRSEILSKDFIKHLEMKDSWWIFVVSLFSPSGDFHSAPSSVAHYAPHQCG